MTDPFRPLKNAFGRFATGVAIASCANARGGLTSITINSFTSVSLDPALVLWCLEKNASSYRDFSTAASYAISILKASQRKTSERFAKHAPQPLASDECEIWKTGAPILRERLAGFDCEVVDQHFSGDHVILVGKVVKFDSHAGSPLLYFASCYGKGPHTD